LQIEAQKQSLQSHIVDSLLKILIEKYHNENQNLCIGIAKEKSLKVSKAEYHYEGIRIEEDIKS
jgi:hypothetical protein